MQEGNNVVRDFQTRMYVNYAGNNTYITDISIVFYDEP